MHERDGGAGRPHQAAQIRHERGVGGATRPGRAGHAHALRRGSPEGTVAYVHGWLSDPDTIIEQIRRCRDDIGAGLAENIDEVGTGASVFLTENLWGVGSTAPYLHDGRATTLTEAILEHGGEATASRNAFTSLTTSKQLDVIAFLDNLVLFKVEEPEAIRPRRNPLSN